MFGRARKTIYEMNAEKTKYDEAYKPKDFLKFTIVPAIYVGALVHISFYWFPLTVLAAVLGALYSLFVAVPIIIKVQYARSSLIMRNKFMTNVSQTIQREGATVIDILRDVSTHRITGELNELVTELIIKTNSASDMEIQAEYQKLIDFYKEDNIFGQFLEHLLTLELQGIEDTTALDETADLHTGMLTRQEEFISEKATAILYYVVNIVVGVVLILMFQWLSNSLLTWPVYLQVYAHAPIGWFFIVFFLFMTFYFNHKAVQLYKDESLMEGSL